MSKFIDMEDQIIERLDMPYGPMRLGLSEALAYLDRYPDQVPGRTITESELKVMAARVGHLERVGDDSRALLGLLGITVIPGTEPTNAEHDLDWWVEEANVNDAEDCDVCEGDLCPVHYGISVGIALLAKKIAALGDDPELFTLIPDTVKAPGGDDADKARSDAAWALNIDRQGGARWQREQLRTDEAVERVALALISDEGWDEWPSNEELGGNLTGDRDVEFKTAWMGKAKEVINASLGEES